MLIEAITTFMLAIGLFFVILPPLSLNKFAFCQIYDISSIFGPLSHKYDKDSSMVLEVY
jgi:hypothetical protein